MKGQVAIPESSEELEELLHDDGRMSEVAGSPELLAEFTQKYQGAWKAKNALAIREMAEKQQADLQAFMKDQLDRHGARAPEGWRPAAAAGFGGQRRQQALAKSQLRNAAEQFERHNLFNPKAIGAELEDAEYQDSIREFIWATIKGEHVAARDGNSELAAKLLALKAKIANTLQVRNAGMSERIPAEGGFLIPETLRSEILALTLEESVVSNQATTIPMDSLRVPIPTIDDTSHASSVFGGVAAAWTAEGGSLSGNESSPKFERILLIANKLTAYTEIPNELLQDSVTAMDVWFNTFFPQALAFFRDVAFLTGNGIDQPLGITKAPGAITLSGTDGITYANVVSMFARMWPGSLKKACWLAAPDAIPELAQMAVTSGSTTVAPPVFLPGMSAMNAPGDYDGRSFTLMGRPGIVTEKMPASGSAGNLAFVDLSKYLVGDRQAMQISSSAEYKFANDMVAYRVIERLDGRPWIQSAITPNNGGDTLSPYVLIGATS